jgi:arabinogalactan oligomer/maltooligosaccharide transport system permease protein
MTASAPRLRHPDASPGLRRTEPAAPPHGRRLLLGLALALVLGVGGSSALLSGARAAALEDASARSAIVRLLAAGELVARAGGKGDAVREAVRGFAERNPGTTARVFLFSGVTLEASTALEDAGDKVAPRRLARDEKPIFDRGQRLRGAIASNREGSAPKPELEVDRLADGGRVLAAPLEVEGEVVGTVQLGTTAEPAPAAPFPWGALLAIVLPLALFALAGRRSWFDRLTTNGTLALTNGTFGLALAAIVALGAGMGLFALTAVRDLAGATREAHASVAAEAKAQGAHVAALLSEAGLAEAPPLSPGRWDADVARVPRGFLAADGAVDVARVEADVAAGRDAAAKTVLAAALAALAALAFVGFGGLDALWRALVTHRQAYAYVAPAILGTLLIVFFPFLYGIALSFTDSNIYNTNQPLTELWVGFKNYASIIGDFGIARRAADGSWVFNYLNFYWTFGFTVFWTVTNVIWGVSFGLLLALVLNTKGLALRPVYRVLLILPWAMPNYITALIWKGMFHSQFGVVNHALAIFGAEPNSWFDTPLTSYATAFATNSWLSFPFMMVVSLGALQSIPADIYEAARVDGASRWQQFTAITLPSLKPALVPAVILSVVWTFNMFNIIYLVTAGDPGGATEILITQAYKFAFERYRYGYAAAYATIIFGILLVYGNVQNRVTRATEGI